MSCVFFYGLFMDAGLLREMGFSPVELGQAALPGYQLRIGERATLVPNKGETAYGMLIELSDEEISVLYSAPDVADYRPESVGITRLDNGTAQPALCYNLPADKLGTKFNSEYAKNLSALLKSLGFPPDYVSDVSPPDPRVPWE